MDALRRKGFGRLLVDGVARDVRGPRRRPTSKAGRRWRWWSIGSASSPRSRTRITDAVEIAYQEGGGAAWVVQLGEDGAPDVRHVFSERFECRTCGLSYEDPQPRLFSFNNPFGACPTCHGFGNIIELDLDLVVPDAGQDARRRARSSRGPSRTTGPTSPT